MAAHPPPPSHRIPSGFHPGTRGISYPCHRGRRPQLLSGNFSRTAVPHFPQLAPRRRRDCRAAWALGNDSGICRQVPGRRRCRVKILRAYTLALLIFLWMPLSVLLFKGLNVAAFEKLLNSSDVLSSFRNSLLLAAGTAILTTTLGLVTAFALPLLT